MASAVGGLQAVAAAQALVTTGGLAVLASTVAPRRIVPLVLAMAAAVAVTPTVLHVSTLMPDVMTLWLALGLAIVATGSGWRFGVGGMLTAVAVLVHYSNLPILALTAPVVLLLSPRRLRAALLLAAIAALGAGGVVANNVAAATGSLFESGSVFFLAGRLNQSEALAASARAAGDPALAAELRTLRREPEALLWDQEGSPLLRRHPRWFDDPAQYRAALAEWRPIVTHGLTHHRRLFLSTAKYNALAMTRGEYFLGGYVHHDPAGPVAEAIARHAPEDLGRFRAGVQARDDPKRLIPVGLFRTMTVALSAIASCWCSRSGSSWPCDAGCLPRRPRRWCSLL